MTTTYYDCPVGIVLSTRTFGTWDNIAPKAFVHNHMRDFLNLIDEVIERQKKLIRLIKSGEIDADNINFALVQDGVTLLSEHTIKELAEIDIYVFEASPDDFKGKPRLFSDELWELSKKIWSE
jgi:hypothetical protein